jgi:hypothetical protein
MAVTITMKGFPNRSLHAKAKMPAHLCEPTLERLSRSQKNETVGEKIRKVLLHHLSWRRSLGDPPTIDSQMELG